MLLAVATLSEHIPEETLLSHVHINHEPEPQKVTPELEFHCNGEDDIIDRHGIPPPAAPLRRISVVINTPLNSQLLAGHIHQSTPPVPHNEEPQIDFASEDNESIWSQAQYGDMDWDHSGDEFENIQVTPRLTRRGSTISPDKLQDAVGPPPDIPGTYKSFGTIEKEGRAARLQLQRDSKGRFAPKAPREEAYNPIIPASKTSGMSLTSQQRPSSAVRDDKGKNVKKAGSATKRERAVSLASDKAPSSQPSGHDSKFVLKGGPLEKPSRPVSPVSEKSPSSLKLKFASTKETPIPPPKSFNSVCMPSSATKTPTKAVPDQGLESPSSAKNAKSSQRDSKGRFQIAKETPIPPPPIRPYLTSSASKGASAPPFESSSAKLEVTSQLIAPSLSQPKSKSKPKRAHAKSPYFPAAPATPKKSVSPTKEPPSSQKRNPGLSCIPFPPLSAPCFGLIQEKLAHDPFKLLIAVTFLIRTHGKHAIPVFYQLISRFPTPQALLAADKETEILPIIQHLGLQNQRANTYQQYAKIWLEDPPVKGRRYKVLGYPQEGDGKDVKKGEVLADEESGEERVGWEIGHMTQGPYALDSWRIFCRDKLRGLADGWNSESAESRSLLPNNSSSPNPLPSENRTSGEGKAFQPEWMRVLPLDKELRAYLRWMWLKEGFEWDPFTGEKEVASPELINAAMEGRLEWDEEGGMRIVAQREESIEL